MKLRVPYTPHQGQRLFHESPARFRVLACGARWGKDRACIAESIRLNAELLQLGRVGLIPRVHGWFVAPNFALARQLWRELKALTPAQVLAKAPNESDYRLEWKGGAVVEVKSADDPHALVAVGLDWVILTEAALLREEAWEMALRPRLASPDRAGLAIFNGTPKGHNRYWHVYLRGQDPNQPDWESWNFPTAAIIGPDGSLQRHRYGNPYVSLKELEQARRDMPERWFRQEFLAEFISAEGAVFPEVRSCIAAPPARPSPPLVAGADLGRRRDNSVFIVFDKQGRMVDMKRLQGVPYRRQARTLCALLVEHSVCTVAVESNGPGDPFVEMLEEELQETQSRCRVEPVQVTAANKRQLIDALVVAFEKGEISILADPVLTGELEAYAAEQTNSGGERFGAPDGGHDDCVMACALAWSQVRGRRHHIPKGRYPTAQQAQELLARLHKPSSIGRFDNPEARWGSTSRRPL